MTMIEDNDDDYRMGMIWVRYGFIIIWMNIPNEFPMLILVFYYR